MSAKRVIAINGSPRKKKNTATLLNYALKGAESVGAETELVHLYDLKYQGCTSCFSCKRKKDASHGRCALRDELSPVLDKVVRSDLLLLGTPIYLHSITGAMQSFLERFIFMNLSYDDSEESYFNGIINIGFIYTMGMPVDMMDMFHYNAYIKTHASWNRLFHGKWEYMTSNDAYQFDDYSKYAAKMFDVEHKTKIRDEQFPVDCQKAYELGKRLVE